jgi:hypothetical protein
LKNPAPFRPKSRTVWTNSVRSLGLASNHQIGKSGQPETQDGGVRRLYSSTARINCAPGLCTCSQRPGGDSAFSERRQACFVETKVAHAAQSILRSGKLERSCSRRPHPSSRA